MQEFKTDQSNLTKFQKLEHVVFIIVCAGTSISQLLGQNTDPKNIKGTRIDGPKDLFKRIFEEKDELGINHGLLIPIAFSTSSFIIFFSIPFL